MAQRARACGLERVLLTALGPWRPPSAVHDPAKIVADLAIAVALGADRAADIAVVRAQPEAFGVVASNPTVSRLIDRLADDADRALGAIRGTRAAARARVWGQAGTPRQAGLVVLDLDATQVTAHSEKEWAAKTWKKGFGFHHLLAYVDHGDGGTGEPVAGLLRRGNAGSNTTADHITVLDALTRLPESDRTIDEHGRRAILVRTDAAGAPHGFAARIHELGMQFSLGAYLH
ncbi:transposase [Saccharopolyspora endophytica]|uniref:Transposase n=1 Tax=Saccharopolyspora endophytica TaxID=543886 RepID=A0ABS5DH40_9PSEU|nr:transposase [Saccharopolyspora endophytica]